MVDELVVWLVFYGGGGWFGRMVDGFLVRFGFYGWSWLVWHRVQLFWLGGGRFFSEVKWLVFFVWFG